MSAVNPQFWSCIFREEEKEEEEEEEEDNLPVPFIYFSFLEPSMSTVNPQFWSCIFSVLRKHGFGPIISSPSGKALIVSNKYKA